MAKKTIIRGKLCAFIPLVMAKTGCNYCKLVVFKKKEEEEEKEVTMSVAAAEEISVGTAVATVLLELDGIFALQGPAVCLAGFGKSFVTHSCIVAHRQGF